MTRLTLAGAALVLAGGLAAPALAAPACENLAGAPLARDGTIESARAVPADDAHHLPAYCEVKAWLTPVPGSRIGAVFRLPAAWNGKLLGLGGGGWAGNVTLAAAADGLRRGYATAQTDGGHPGTGIWDNSWAVQNKEAATDFSWRAIHETNQAARALVRTVYGKPQTRAYYQGCSTGGRMGLMEAQRYPQDYDGIVAGAPVYTLQVQTSAILRGETFSAVPASGFTDAELRQVNDAVLKACDTLDGQADGVLADPRRCGWTPEQMACHGDAQIGFCLSPAQVTALRTAYAGIRTRDGQWAAFPLAKGGEAGWSRFVGTSGGKDQTNGGGMATLQPLLFGSTPVDMGHLRADPDVTVARSSAFAREYEAKDPNLSPFFARGGKLILWHGWSDPGPSPVGTEDYYRAVLTKARGADGAIRLFFAPGTEHCGGGPGANQPDTLTALEEWIERGSPPATILATRADGTVTRPLCAYPKVARWTGRGDGNDPAAYRCT